MFVVLPLIDFIEGVICHALVHVDHVRLCICASTYLLCLVHVVRVTCIVFLTRSSNPESVPSSVAHPYLSQAVSRPALDTYYANVGDQGSLTNALEFRDVVFEDVGFENNS